jgi:hypothetical protein
MGSNSIQAKNDMNAVYVFKSFFTYFQCSKITNMKKCFALLGIVAAVFTFSNCNPARKASTTAPVVAKATYASDVTTVIMSNCTPCHVPAKGGNKKPYDNYANAKTDIDEILRRIQLNPGDKGFMPFKHPKLNDSTINVFKKWKEDGLLEM